MASDNQGIPWRCEQYEVRCRLGYRTENQSERVTLAVIRASKRMRYPHPMLSAVPNISGPRQTKCIDFPDAILDCGEPAIPGVVETPGQGIEPVPTVDHTGRPVPRQSDRPYLIWWLMNQQPCKDMVAELQPHDKDDLRQDMAVKYWRQSVKQEANGNRITNPARYIAKAVAEWIGENIETARGEPLTQQQREDAVDALDAQRKASEESRLEKREAELKIEQGRFIAALTAKRDAKNPESLYCFKW
jgi:hypothetical protein